MITTTLDKVILAAEEVYRNEDCARSFEEDLYLHLHTPGCIVFKDEDNLALVRPVNEHDSYENLTYPGYISPEPNAWWVYMLVGNVPFLISLLPNRFDRIGWERKNKPRFYNLNKVKQWTSTMDHTGMKPYL